jgi:hypothetical protein
MTETRVVVGKWTHPRKLTYMGGYIFLEVMIGGCNCPLCMEKMIDVGSTLKGKNIPYDLHKSPPDGWSIRIKGDGNINPMKTMSDAIGLEIRLLE